MIRLLTATLLVASFSVAADTEVPHTFEDGNPAKASEVNENFDALEEAIDAIPADAVEAVTSADLDMDGNKVLFSNVYSRLADLPSASDNHGMFAHVHETGEAYFAHAGNWIQIAKQSSIDGESATPFSALTCTTNQIIKYDGNEWVCAAMPADGAKGDTGEKGDTGPPGTNGLTGANGPAGPPGADGLDGATGPPGADGPDGATGPPGADGLDGATGPPGADGPDGATGPPGADGLDGATGPPGADGPDGATGPPGADGLDGATGPPGADGLDGATGPPGADGVAAGLNCTTDQIIRYDGNNWVCAYQHRGELYTVSWDTLGYFANGYPYCELCQQSTDGLFSVITRQISTDRYGGTTYGCGFMTFGNGVMYPDCDFSLPALGSHSGCTMTLSENSGSLDGYCGTSSCEFDGTKLVRGEPARITVVCPD